MYSNKCVANVDAQRSQNLNPRWMCSGNGCGVSACIVSCHILNVAQREDEAVGGPGASPSWKVYKTVQDKFHVSCGPGRRTERETWCYHVCHTISSGLRQTKYQTYTSLKTAGSGLKSTADELDVSICSRVMASWGVNCWNWGLKNTRKKKSWSFHEVRAYKYQQSKSCTGCGTTKMHLCSNNFGVENPSAYISWNRNTKILTYIHETCIKYLDSENL